MAIFSVPVNITTHLPEAVFVAPVSITTKGQATVTAPVNLTTVALPITSNTSFGSGFIATPRTNHSVVWSATVTLDGVDVTTAVTQDIRVTHTPSAARVCELTLKLSKVNTSISALSQKPIMVRYFEFNPATLAQTASYTLFSGYIDEPQYDFDNGLLHLTCSDDIHRAVNSLSSAQVNAIVPKAYWSKFLFEEYGHKWEYLLQQIETYPYMVYMDDNRQIRAVEEVSALPVYQFGENQIIAGSAQFTLARSKDIVNSVNVTLTYAKDEFREEIETVSWVRDIGDAVGAGCSVQMVLDAVGAAEAAIVGEPEFTILRATYTDANNVVIVNSGNELLTTGCYIKMAKRYKQQVERSYRVTVGSKQSQDVSGILLGSEQASITAETIPEVTDWFTEQEDVTRYWCTASTGDEVGAEKPETIANRPLRPISGQSGFEPYPAMPAKFKVWKTGAGTSRLNLKAKAKVLNSAAASVDPGSATGAIDLNDQKNFYVHSYPGSTVYNMDAYIKSGNMAEANTAYEALVAKATTSILRSHRSNIVKFSTTIKPFINLGTSVRVDLPKVKVTGLVYSVEHLLNPKDGKATSTFELRSSTVKPFKALPTGEASVTISAPVAITVASGTYTNPVTVSPTTSQPVAYTTVNAPDPIIYDHFYGTHTFTDVAAIQPGWLGQICPLSTSVSGDNIFRVYFPTVNADHVNTHAVTVKAPDIDVKIPEDEFYIRG